MIDYVKENISTEQSSSRQDTRVSRADGDQERSSGAEKTPREGAQTSHPDPLLEGLRAFV